MVIYIIFFMHQFPSCKDEVYNLFCYLQVDYMEPIVEKITLVEDARFDSPKSMFMGRVMGKSLIYHVLIKTCNAFIMYYLFYLSRNSLDVLLLVCAHSEVGDIDYEIQRHNAPGFIGCISGVRYNVYTPLKAFFRPNETDPPVTTQGYVSESNCGAFPPVLGYVPWEADPWFTSIGEFICPIMYSFHVENIVCVHPLICITLPFQSIYISMMT